MAQQQQQNPRLKLGTQGPEKEKGILHFKMVKTGLANKIEEQRLMVESLIETKRDAVGTVASLEHLKMRMDELMDNLNSGIDESQILRALETLLMLELDYDSRTLRFMVTLKFCVCFFLITSI
ncbi:hypothetical protein V6N13_014702 [Hibiscus sabdariffa]|uniref:Uncharacterized protein n=1 Tax=Hibiscus sabdariffa TaxID=183260 RepID=A0ABR2RW39_9ROSI